MVTYKLVSKSDYNQKKIVLQKHKLSEIDKFIYSNFKTEYELSNYFNVDNGRFYITYTYQNNPKILDIILNDDNKDFAFLLFNSKNYKVDTNSTIFRNYFNRILKEITMEDLLFLFYNNYIDKRTYENILNMKTISKSNLEYHRDMAELFTYIKQDLKRYINFRKLYSGVIAYHNRKKSNDSDNKVVIANTSNEHLNHLYNYGGLDELYAYYDLDELAKLDGVDDLGIDLFSKKK